MKEIWKDIKGYEGLYKISNLGNVINVKTNNFKKASIDTYGYYDIVLNKNGKHKHYRLHRLLASHFIANPNNLPCVNHINEIKSDNRLENLEWCTGAYNTQYSCNKAVRCIETGQIFNSGADASKYYNLAKNAVSSAIFHNCKAANLHWEYI